MLVAEGMATASSLDRTLNKALSYSRQKEPIEIIIEFKCLGFQPKQENKLE